MCGMIRTITTAARCRLGSYNRPHNLNRQCPEPQGRCHRDAEYRQLIWYYKLIEGGGGGGLRGPKISGPPCLALLAPIPFFSWLSLFRPVSIAIERFLSPPAPYCLGLSFPCQRPMKVKNSHKTCLRYL